MLYPFCIWLISPTLTRLKGFPAASGMCQALATFTETVKLSNTGLLGAGCRNQLTSVPRAIYLLGGRHAVLPRALPQLFDVWRWIGSFLADAIFLAKPTVSAPLCFQEHDWLLQALSHVSAQCSPSRPPCLPCSAGRKNSATAFWLPAMSSHNWLLCMLFDKDKYMALDDAVCPCQSTARNDALPSFRHPLCTTSPDSPPLGHGLAGWIFPGCREQRLSITQVLSAQTSY